MPSANSGPGRTGTVRTVPNTPKNRGGVKNFAEIGRYYEYPYAIAGVTKDSTGAVLGNCSVDLFKTDDDTKIASTSSDANGIYSIPASQYITCYAVAYKAGAPDVAGTTVNTLVGT